MGRYRRRDVVDWQTTPPRPMEAAADPPGPPTPCPSLSADTTTARGARGGHATNMTSGHRLVYGMLGTKSV